MQISKSLFLKAFLVMNVLALAACDLPSPSKKTADSETQAEGEGFTNSGSGTFTVELSTSKSSMLEAQTTGTFQLPTAKIYNIVACLKDVAYNKPIQGHKFNIKELNQDTTTDSAGCLTWKENIKYNYLGDSKYLRFERHILGTGLHRGSRLVTFAINPWSHGENLTSVLEIKANTEIPQLIKEAGAVAQALKGRPRSLWVEDGRLFMTEQKFTKTGVDLVAEFRTTPSVQLKKLNGELFTRPLTAGTFRARLKIIHSYMHNDKEVRRLLGQSQPEDITMTNANLSVKHVISLSAIPTRGQIIIGVELIPLNGPADLTSFDGIYLLGDFDSLKGSAFLKLSTLVGQTENFKISDYITVGAPALTGTGKGEPGSDPSLDSDAYQKPKIEFRYVDSPSYLYLPEKELTSTRTIRVNLHTCLVNGIDQKILRAHTFNITKFREDGSTAAPEVIPVETSNSSSGCLTWYEDITFKAFECHHYLKGTVKIENVDLGISETLNMYLNPWDPYALVRDSRSLAKNEKLVTTCKQDQIPRTAIYLEGYTYSMGATSYKIDSMLNMSVSKKVQLRMDPRMNVYSSTSQGRGDPQKLRDGIYVLKTAVIRNKDYDRENTLVAYDQKLVAIQAGQINTELNFTWTDLRAMSNLNSMVIELYPAKESKITLENGKLPANLKKLEIDNLIDQESLLESGPFIGPVNLSVPKSSDLLMAVDNTIMSTYFITGKMPAVTPYKSFVSGLVAQSRSLRAEVRAKQVASYSTAAFAKENNLDLVNLAPLDARAPLAQQFAKPTVDERLIPTRQELQDLVASGHLTNNLAQKMCNFWANDYMQKMYPEKGGAFMKDMTYNFAMSCYNASRKDTSKFFQTEKRLLIRELGSSEYIAGIPSAVSVGTSFSLATNHSNYSTTAKSWATKAGLGLKFLDLFSLGTDFSYQMTVSDSKGSAAVNSIAVNGQTTLAVVQQIFKLNVNQYEQCVVVRLNPRLFVPDDSFFGSKGYAQMLNPTLTEQESVDAVTRGLFLCEGRVRTEPIQLTENYYVLNQEAYNSSQVADLGDVRNRHFFVALRSKNDYNRFLIAMKSVDMPKDALKEHNANQEASDHLLKLFDMPGSSAPGMYLVQ